ARAGADHAGAFFVNRVAYAHAALDHLGTPAPGGHAPDWSAAGVGLGVASGLLAVGFAALGLYAAPLGRRARALAGGGRQVLKALRTLHSGHVGDYVAWMLTGMAGVAALVGLPLVR
ncbi:MAG TPA: hypothetical protein VKU91_10010, partial [Acidimicrobiales bacterium]|nr:hypothetical protein [Acidimicrobiales bacterium]